MLASKENARPDLSACGERVDLEYKINYKTAFLCGLLIFILPIAAWELFESKWPVFVAAVVVIFWIMIKLRLFEAALGKRKFVWDLSGLTAQAAPIVASFTVVGWALPTSFEDKKDAVLLVVAIILALISCIGLAEGKFPDRLIDGQRDEEALRKRSELTRGILGYLGVPAFFLGLAMNLL